MRAGRQRGFTLIELMLVVVIVAILVAVAIPSYRNQVIKANRAVAKAKLLDIAARQEQYHADNKVYSNTLAAFTGLATTDGGVDGNFNWVATGSGDSVYTVSIATAGANQAYTLTATPVNAQAEDADCGALTLTSTGVRAAAGSLGTACWD